MKVLLFNRTNSYLFYDLTEGLKELGHEVHYAYGKADNKPEYINGLMQDLEQKSKDFDLIIQLNYFAPTSKALPWEKTLCLYVDPPHHFGACPPFKAFQIVKVGPFDVIDWGVGKRWLETKAVEPEYKALMCARIDKNQENGLFFSNPQVYEDFATRNMIRVMAATKLAAQYGPQDFKILGEPHDYGRFFINTDRPHMDNNETLAKYCQLVPHELLHLEFNKADYIIDQVRPAVGLNPKVLYAWALGKAVKNIEYQNGEIKIVNLRQNRELRPMKDFCEDLLNRFELSQQQYITTYDKPGQYKRYEEQQIIDQQEKIKQQDKKIGEVKKALGDF